MQGFRALPLKITSSSSTTHTLFLKEHSVREHSNDKPSGRTLFVLNIPPFVEADNLKHVFKSVGNVVSVQLRDKPSSSESPKEDENNMFSEKPKMGFKVGYIVFSKVAELTKALQLNELKPLTDDNVNLNTGVVKWIKDYNASIVTEEDLKKEIDTFMNKYDNQVKEKIIVDKALTEADDEGWVTVTKQSRKTGFQRNEQLVNKITAKENARQEKKELKNFYTFQIRESKMKHIISLRQKFEEDKKKIAILKESRRFKPF